MGTWLQFGNAEICRAFGIGTKIVSEVIIQVVCFRRISVDDELQVMPNTVARGVYTILVRYFRHEIGSGIHVAPIYKRRGIEITIDGRADRVRTIDIATS